MQSPHAAVVAFCGEQRAGIVGDTFHADLRFRRAALPVPSNARARARPSLSSAGVNAPWTRSQAASPRRPASIRNRRDAVAANHPLKVSPLSCAARSIATASSGERETERFVLLAMLDGSTGSRTRCTSRRSVARLHCAGTLVRFRVENEPGLAAC
jgi:hypothetical protein